MFIARLSTTDAAASHAVTASYRNNVIDGQFKVHILAIFNLLTCIIARGKCMSILLVKL
jgi:hypothetical protein